MAEVIVATSVVSPHAQTRLEVISREPIGMGVETKNLLTANVIGATAMGPLTYVERDYSDPYERRARNTYIKNYTALREAGVPVVPEVLTTDNDRLLVTDVKADGSEVYGRGMAWALSWCSDDSERSRPHRDVDPHFLRLTSPEKLPDIEKQASVYAANAAEHDIVLAADDPFELKVGPDGRWDLIALDLSEAVTGFSAQRGYNPRIHGTVAELNAGRVQNFMRQLVRVHAEVDRLRLSAE